MALPSVYSVSVPVQVVDSGGILVRQVDGNGAALDDPTYVYSTALPVTVVDVAGSNEDGSKSFSVWLKVTTSLSGIPVVRVDPQGNVDNTPFSSISSETFLSPLSLSSTTFEPGAPSNGTINNATLGSTIIATGLPTGLTINSSARTWSWDGTGTEGSGTITLTETLVLTSNSPLDTLIDYTITAVLPGIVYDASIGNGVDSAGFADLPLRSGAKRYFVNNLIGSDTHTSTQAQDPTTPIATFAKAKTFVVDGQGDQVLVAERTTYGESLNKLLEGKNGFSELYPLVWQSYDPADPLNEAKYGRASGSNRPVLTTTTLTMVFSSSGITPSYVAMRGFDFNPGNVSGAKIVVNSAGATGSKLPLNYLLFENNLFRYTMLSRNADVGSGAHGYIVRNCSFYGSWNTSGYTQGAYVGSMDGGITFEDNVFWHNGWKIGASRSDDQTLGGLAGGAQTYQKNHPVYAQNDNSGIIYRRNLIIDGPADGGHILGEHSVTENMVIDCPIGLDLQGGTSYAVVSPSGRSSQSSYNVIVGSAANNSETPSSGHGIWTGNGTAGSSSHHNIIVQARVLGASPSGSAAFENWNPDLTPSDTSPVANMDFHDNIAFNRNASGSSTFVPTTDGPTVTTFTNNKWDDPSDGNGNVQATAGMFPNPYDVDGLITAAGYTGADAAARKQALIDYAINNPEAHPGRDLANLMYDGYGIDHHIESTTSTPDVLNFDFIAGTYSIGGTDYGSLASVPGYSYTRSGSISVPDSDGSMDTFTANVVPINGFGLHNYAALTNLLKASADLTSASWGKSQVTITGDTTAAPDGTTTADTATVSAPTGTYNVRQNVTATNAQPYTLSFFALRGTAPDLNYALLAADNATVISQGSYYSQTNSSTFSRIVVPFTANGVSSNVRLLSGSASFSGTAFLWGAQVLNANLPDGGPYIPTTTATASIGAATLSVTLPDGSYTATYTFDDDTTQDIATTVSSSTFTLATAPTLNRGRIKTLVLN